MNSQSGLLKKINERKILNMIRQNDAISRAELARRLKLTLPTVSRIVDDLLERDWLVSVGMGDSSGGRPPSLVKINPEGIGVIGVDLGRESIRLVYTDLFAQILFSDEKLIHDVNGPEGLIEYLKAFIRLNEISKDRIIGIGIGAPGPLDPLSGKLLSPEDVFTKWIDSPICNIIHSELGLNSWLANDAEAAALAENWFGHGKNINSTVFVLQDVGIGSGIVLDGSIWSGVQNSAGEISHMVVNMNGEKCFCGKTGCVDTYASIYEIRRKVGLQRKLDPNEPFSVIIERAKAGKEPDHSIIRTASEYVAAGILNLVQAVDVETIILGGQTLLADETYLATLVRSKLHELLGDLDREVAVTGFGVDAVSIGAATLVLQQIYDHTQLINNDSGGGFVT